MRISFEKSESVTRRSYTSLELPIARALAPPIARHAHGMPSCMVHDYGKRVPLCGNSVVYAVACQ